jgi:VWFA-related protein
MIGIAVGVGIWCDPLAGQSSSGQTSPRPAGVQSPQPADPPEQETPQPIFRTGINFVRVDAIVTDGRGNPLPDMKPEEFEITEDGKPQKIESFRLIALTGDAPRGETARAIRNDNDEEFEAQREDVRIFVILLDDYHVRRGSSIVAREPLINFIRTQLGPMDLLGVMYPLTPVTEMRLTRDHEGVARTVERFEGRKFDYRPRNEFEEKYSMYPAEVVERIRNQVSLSALEGLAVRLGGIREGRKAIVLVSEGYSNYIPPQLRDPVADLPGFANPRRGRPSPQDNSAVEERAQFFSSADLQTELREVYAAANRGNTAIYALDPRGLAPYEFDINEGVGQRVDSQMLNATMDTLRTLADQTDGRAIVNRNDLEGGLKQVVRDSSLYYLIGYNSTQAPADGKFHEIKVRVKRSGAQVRARKGYWALTPEEAARATAPPKPGPDPGVSKALASVEGTSRAQLVRTWVGMAAGDEGKTRVTLVWEPVPPLPGSDRRSGPVRVSLIAAGDEVAAPYFRGTVPDGTTADVDPTKGGRAIFEASPGALQLRLAIQDREGRVVDTDLVDLQVPDYTLPDLAMTTPEVYAVRTARELQTLNADPQPVPVAGREFRRTERLIVRFQALAPGGATATTGARLLNRAGNQMANLTVQPTPDGNGRSQVDLPLAGLPPGEYVVEIKASAGGSDTKQLLGFRVIS